MTELIVAFSDFANGSKNPPAQFFGSRCHQPLEKILAQRAFSCPWKLHQLFTMNLYFGHSFGRAGGNIKRLLRPCAVSDLNRPEYDMQLRTGLYSNAHNKLISSSKKRDLSCEIWGSHGGYEFQLSPSLRQLFSLPPGKYMDMPKLRRWGPQVPRKFRTNLSGITSHKIIKVNRWSFPCLRHKGIYWEQRYSSTHS
jgi:hypothetical protein